MTKVIFFDIDGTLMDKGAVISNSTRNALHKLRENGHRIVVCSGRANYQIPEWLEENFDGIVSATGSCVRSRGEKIYEHFVSREDARLVREALLRAHGILVGQTDRETVLSQESYDYMLYHLKKQGRSEERIQLMLGNAVITETMEDCSAVRKYFYHRSDKTVQEFSDELGELFDFAPASFGSSDAGCGEITCKGINKSFGMLKYILHEDISAADTIAFGDGPNDTDMIDFAGIGIAMGNATENLKARADMVTKDITEDGIEYALKKLGLI